VSSASVGVNEQIESFLQTVMHGLMEKETQEGAAEQKGEPGRPVSRPSYKFVDGSARSNLARAYLPARDLAVIGTSPAGGTNQATI
jgi:hypothetical protein